MESDQGKEVKEQKVRLTFVYNEENCFKFTLKQLETGIFRSKLNHKEKELPFTYYFYFKDLKEKIPSFKYKNFIAKEEK